MDSRTQQARDHSVWVWLLPGGASEKRISAQALFQKGEPEKPAGE